MTLDPRFVYLAPVQEVILDKDTGEPLSAGIVSFFRDAARTTPKNVYALTGSFSGGYTYTNIGSVITLSSIGSFTDGSGNDIIPMLFPYDGTPATSTGTVDLYYITVVAAAPPVGSGALQFTRQAWPNTFSSSSASTSFFYTQNILSNPQFSQVSFNAGQGNVALSLSGTPVISNIAPDWVAITNGTGILTLTQIGVADTNTFGNPSYALGINSTGFSQPIQLRQRLTNTTRILSNATGPTLLDYAYGYLEAKSLDGSTPTLTLTYIDSTGNSTTLVTGSCNNVSYSKLTSATAVQINPPNTGSAPGTYVDIILTIPVGVHIAVTNFQVVGVPTSSSSALYLQQSTGRDIDQLFHFYQNEIIMKPKDDILTGWNFGLNPWQFTTKAATNVATNTYTADQTIVIQQNYVASATGNNIKVGQAGSYNDGFLIQANNATNQFAILNYIDVKTIAPYWSYYVSSLFKGIYFANAGSTPPQLKMRLLVFTAAPSATTQTYPISSWTASGGTGITGPDPVFAGGITAIAPLNDPVYTLSSVLGGEGANSFPTFSFNQFLLPTISNATQYLGVLLYSVSPMSSSDQIVIESLSLVPNRFAVDSNPKTFDQVLRECQYYFETNYNYGDLPGTVTTYGAAVQQALVTTNCRPLTFTIPYRTIKRKAPSSATVTLYSPNSGASANVFAVASAAGGASATADAAITNWTFSYNGHNSVSYVAATASNLATQAGATEGYILYNFAADARISVL